MFGAVDAAAVVAVVAWSLLLLAVAALAARKALQAERNARRSHRIAVAAVEEAKRADARREAQFQSIADMEAERDEWQQLYRRHALEHGNAQALLFNELTRVVALARKKGVELEVNRTVREAVLEYHEAHVTPQLKDHPELKVIRPAEEK